ncbi:MAG: BamA/TamA family outer membrane protein [Bacteroidota bacterium]|nr:BamA/TamA family outer membrane protein [Bacteroidota bacterium]
MKTIIAGWFMVSAVSCTIVKKYQPNKPFVYKTNINLIGNFSNEEKDRLITSLKGQLDDSVVVKIAHNPFPVIRHPSQYDSTAADRSIMFMRALLISLGYFGDSMWYDHKIKVVNKDQYRTTINFYVRPGNQVKLDSISYSLKQPELQRLTDSSRNQALIKKGDPFAKAAISAELDRLTELYRNNGYLRFTRDQLVGIWDTLDVSLLQPNLGFFEQLQALKRQSERRQNPTANLEIYLKNADSVKLTKYYIGNVTIYPAYSVDTSGRKREDIVKGIRVIQYGKKKFKASIFPPNIYLPRDSVYRQRRYVRTLNRLNVIGAWRLVNIDQVLRKGQDTVDFVIRLTPAKKQSFTTNLEGSINQSAISGTLFGLGVNAGIQNRNAWKAANYSSTNLRYGIEFGNSGSDQFIQTRQISASNNIYFPRAVLFDKYIPENRKDNWRTVFSTNAAYTDRRFLFSLTTFNVAWGYEYQRRKLLLTFKFPNIEYSFLKKRDSLDHLIRDNPSLKNIFTDGLIVSSVVNLTLTGGKGNGLNVFRANFEGAPYFAGWIHNNAFLDSQLYRFVKLDAEFARLVRFRKSSIAMRVFGGVGLADPFNTTVNPDKTKSLPFFKQYFSGGPNSMRAWSLRRLGPGSTIKDFVGGDGTPDRYGDMQLEANLEYRFPIAKPLGVKVNGALFTDIGNVWLLKNNAGPPEEVFDFSHLGKDIAVGAGAGLRIDLDFFVIRFDYSYKVKDPSPSLANASLQNKWFGYPFFKGAQFQLGIGYPFIF